MDLFIDLFKKIIRDNCNDYKIENYNANNKYHRATDISRIHFKITVSE